MLLFNLDPLTTFDEVVFVLFFVQVQDYGVLLKMKSGELLVTATLRLLKVFLCIQPGQEYVRSIVNQLLTIKYWEINKNILPFWEILKDDPAAFNEESVELSFSLLGRSLAGDSKKTDREHVQKKYLGVKSYMAAKKDFVKDLASPNTMKSVSGRFEVKKESTKLAQVKEWMLIMINQAKFNAYAPYCDTKAFKSLNEANKTDHRSDPNKQSPVQRTYLQDSASVLVAMKQKLIDGIENNWAETKFSEAFQHMRPRNDVVAQRRDMHVENVPNAVIVRKRSEQKTQPRKNKKGSNKKGGGGKEEKPLSEDDQQNDMHDDDEEVELSPQSSSEENETMRARPAKPNRKRKKGGLLSQSSVANPQMNVHNSKEKKVYDELVKEWKQNNNTFTSAHSETLWAKALLAVERERENAGEGGRTRRGRNKPNGFYISAGDLDVLASEENMLRAAMRLSAKASEK